MASSRSNQLPNNNIQRIVTAPPERFLPRAKLILEAESVQIPEDKLLGALHAGFPRLGPADFARLCPR